MLRITPGKPIGSGHQSIHVGAIAVSGAPGGEADDVCAKAGVDAIRQDIDF